MDGFVYLDWRVYPASILMGVGVVLAVVGTTQLWAGLSQALRTDPSKILTLLQGFRLLVIGLALTGIGTAWAWHLLVLLVLALAIGGEELLESSVHIYAVRRSRGLEENRASGILNTGETEWTQPPATTPLSAKHQSLSPG